MPSAGVVAHAPSKDFLPADDENGLYGAKRIAAMVDEPGRIAVAGKLLADIVASLPNKEVGAHSKVRMARRKRAVAVIST